MSSSSQESGQALAIVRVPAQEQLDDIGRTGDVVERYLAGIDDAELRKIAIASILMGVSRQVEGPDFGEDLREALRGEMAIASKPERAGFGRLALAMQDTGWERGLPATDQPGNPGSASPPTPPELGPGPTTKFTY